MLNFFPYPPKLREVVTYDVFCEVLNWSRRRLYEDDPVEWDKFEVKPSYLYTTNEEEDHAEFTIRFDLIYNGDKRPFELKEKYAVEKHVRFTPGNIFVIRHYVIISGNDGEEKRSLIDETYVKNNIEHLVDALEDSIVKSFKSVFHCYKCGKGFSIS